MNAKSEVTSQVVHNKDRFPVHSECVLRRGKFKVFECSQKQPDGTLKKWRTGVHNDDEIISSSHLSDRSILGIMIAYCGTFTINNQVL